MHMQTVDTCKLRPPFLIANLMQITWWRFGFMQDVISCNYTILIMWSIYPNTSLSVHFFTHYVPRNQIGPPIPWDSRHIPTKFPWNPIASIKSQLPICSSDSFQLHSHYFTMAPSPKSSPQIRSNRWFLNHPQMGCWWHCFTCIVWIYTITPYTVTIDDTIYLMFL